MPHPDEYLDPDEPIHLPTDAVPDPMVSYIAGLLTQALWDAKNSDALRLVEVTSWHVGATWETALTLASGKRIRVTVEVQDA